MSFVTSYQVFLLVLELDTNMVSEEKYFTSCSYDTKSFLLVEVAMKLSFY